MQSRSVLFVCLGNICRSPAAEEVLRVFAKAHGIRDLEVASCGIGEWHIGKPADRRMIRACAKHGYDLTGRAQLFEPHYFDTYDHILAADASIEHWLLGEAPTAIHRKKVALLAPYGGEWRDIPDPYHGTEADFEQTIDLIEKGCMGLLTSLYPDAIA